ncbi:uncharacterized protein TRIADDRAFT_56623 [Trichoplax adhaerens]|uniref:G-protein coupled receptors family 1 profile domain-containing protein n=1 Tax=Trichoplax adhaerens TaxID=10228 RepID=B3RYN9_TRIAD|nr:hypothetical protein TRIADDRAFT_56623 [Trichoplax adhaerens]EDV25074.1 hypothetical protein TRIADDRAFT_56623 [Trichoplax adhaerens]|eukprot:XP_002112964.1 hypothetical protein TRIADDRAFT_56623 [Trichoplax adhaerens]
MVKTSDHLPRWNDQRFHNSTQVAINYSIVNIYAYSAAIPLSVIGFIANLLLLYLIKSDRHFRSMTYNLIQISVISDLLSLMGTMTGFTLVAAVKIGYFWGSILCKCLLFTIFISYGVSITTLCMISIDRYLAIVKPISVTTLKYKKRLVYVGQCLGCLITLGIALPILYLANVYREDTKFCDVPNVSVSTAVYLVLQGVFMYLIPMLILVITYGKIVKYQTHYVQPGQNRATYEKYFKAAVNSSENTLRPLHINLISNKIINP